mmetsp:Transcript_46654/g.99610  ORF Transcript_46654/g.99610 Transcript_46654/m.99610 type:complete len:195 (+) Transcript_46654:123-707(+)
MGSKIATRCCCSSELQACGDAQCSMALDRFSQERFGGCLRSKPSCTEEETTASMQRTPPHASVWAETTATNPERFSPGSPGQVPETELKAAGPGSGHNFDFQVLKAWPDDSLGLDMRHLQTRLQVDRIFKGGAVERANQLSPPEKQLRPGDIVLSVNGVCGSDVQMVAECRLATNVILSVERCEESKLAAAARM